MNEPPSSGSPPPVAGPPADRLDSWKEIAAYLKRDVTTVQRWEKREGMPVQRHLHDKMGSVFAFRTDLDTWARSRHLRDEVRPLDAGEPADVPVEDRAPRSMSASATPSATTPRRWSPFWLLIAAGIVAAMSAAVWLAARTDYFWRNPIAEARFLPVTDFEGSELAAAISRDGKFVAFLSDRDGPMAVWVTQVGTGRFYRLTEGSDRELTNPAVRTLGFSPDGALVTFWTRKPGGAQAAGINVWAVPTLGGQPRPYMENVAELDWSRDGSRLIFHTPEPGDPMFLRDPGQPPEGRRIFTVPGGLHGHFLQWSPDQAFIYFVQGSVPDSMDIWRIRPNGEGLQRITHHESRVSHPVFLNQRTLMYLATDQEGSGPWLHTVDVERRTPHRVSSGVDRYTSLAASADGRRLVVTLANPKQTLWRLPLANTPATASAASRIPLTTGSGFSPRLGPGYLLYVASKGASESIWKLQDEKAVELWNGPGARVLGGPALASDGERIAFSIRQGDHSSLYVMNADGTEARMVTGSLDLRGGPAWAPDGRSITSAAMMDGVPRLFTIPLDGGSPVPLVPEHSVDPVWSPDGRFVVYSGADIGTTFAVKAVTSGAVGHALPNLTLTRGARHLRFLPGGRALVVLRGEIRHKNLWSIDLETGAERQLTDLPPDFDVHDFDLSPDGREVVVERVLEYSDIVMLDLPSQ